MYTIQMVNFTGQKVGSIYLSLEEAIRKCKDIGFETVIYKGTEAVGTYCVIGGYRRFLGV